MKGETCDCNEGYGYSADCKRCYGTGLVVGKTTNKIRKRFEKDRSYLEGMGMNYKNMWNELKRAVEFDLSMLADPKTTIEFADIQRMASAKLIQQTMIKIENKEKTQ